MYVRNEIRPSIILWFCWKHVVFFALYGVGVVALFVLLKIKFIAIPFLPVGTIGTAVAFYVGFKNHASYERLWEGRKIWGTLANLSRAIASLTLALPDGGNVEVKLLQQRLVRRQIAWCNALRLTLRNTGAHRNAHKVPPEVALVQMMYGDAYGQETLQQYFEVALPVEDREQLKDAANPPFTLLHMQIADVERLADISPTKSTACDRLLEAVMSCIQQQGASERLKSFPFPRQYAHFSGVFVWIFLLLLPFGLIDELTKHGSMGSAWLVVPFSTLISWMFVTMEQVGDSSEDPFELALNDVPLTAICRNIEIELLQMLGETNLPERIKPIQDVLL